jgi:hypothetical protein
MFSTSDTESWREACTSAATSNWMNFRRNPAHLRIVEGMPKYAGQDYLRNLRASAYRDYLIQFALELDKIGNPRKSIGFLFKSRLVRLSPASLRYASNAATILNRFGLEILKSEIVEIGGGFGGDATVLLMLRRVFGYQSSDYRIYDLPTSIPLIKRVLTNFNFKNVLVDSIENIYETRDHFVISCAAFSEMSDPILSIYFTNSIKYSVGGYFITNFEQQSLKLLNGWTSQNFHNMLINSDFRIDYLDVTTTLSEFDLNAGTQVLIFNRD